MTIIRREHKAHFTIMPNAVFVDTRLSVEAKGVLGYLLSRPHKWRVRHEHVARTLKVGRKKLQRSASWPDIASVISITSCATCRRL